MTDRTPPFSVPPGAPARLSVEPVPIPDGCIDALVAVLGTNAVHHDDGARTAAARDWWPISVVWARAGAVAARPGVVVAPVTVDGVAAVVRIAREYRIPVTAAGGRSGVLGGAVAVCGGIMVDLTALEVRADIDHTSMLATCSAGWWGDELEDHLRREGVTLGHWPQSIDISTLGGWIACRGAGQMSTRYGKIEDMVMALECVTGRGDIARIGRAPRSATGPDLVQTVLGSEGAFAIVTEATLRVHPAPAYTRRGAWLLPSFEASLDVIRRAVQRGARPAVVRAYDVDESARTQAVKGSALLVLDEGDHAVVDATFAVLEAELTSEATPLDTAIVERWWGHRNDVSALASAVEIEMVADTIEISARWSVLTELHKAVIDAITAIDGTLVASAHCSHAYTDGGCLYFTFAGSVGTDLEEKERYYRAVWAAAMRTVITYGAAVSHHHGIGKHRGPALRESIGETAWALLIGVKQAFDPDGILNPGVLGLPSPYLSDDWSWS